jgi:hypothetical protein
MVTRVARAAPVRRAARTDSRNRREFGRLLRTTLARANVSLPHVAQIANVQEFDVFQTWFRGSGLPNPAELHAITRYLGLMGAEETRFFEHYEAAVRELLDAGGAVPSREREVIITTLTRAARTGEGLALLEEFGTRVNKSPGPFVQLQAGEEQEPHHQERPGVPSPEPQPHAETVRSEGPPAPEPEPDQGVSTSRRGSAPPPLLADPDGNDGRPDPLIARTEDELAAVLREFWQWTGGYSSRDLSQWSGGAFSHTTANALLSDKTTVKRPRLKLEYVRGVIRACGGDADELLRWSKAWRLVRGNATGQNTPGKHVPDRPGDVVRLQSRRTG